MRRSYLRSPSSHVVILLLGCLPHTLPAHAQAPEEPKEVSTEAPAGNDETLPPAYKRAVTLAMREYRARNYAEARARFMEAHRAFPNARSLRSLGKVEYDLKNYLASIDYLQQALASQVRPLDDALRADVQELLGLARGYVATYAIALDPTSAHLEVDGQPRELGDGQIQLQVGAHELAAAADGYRTARRRIEVEGGLDQSIEIRLTPLPEPVHSEKSAAKWWVIGGVGGALLAGVAVGVALSLRGSKVESTDGGSTMDTIVLSDP